MTLRTLAVLGIVSLAVSGCGTFNTVFRDDIAATRELRKQKTYCEAIPRIYSGVAFDFACCTPRLTRGGAHSPGAG